jgi:opacity protein-like surface antigen
MTIHSTLLASAVLAVLSLSAAQAAQPLQAARAGDQVPPHW